MSQRPSAPKPILNTLGSKTLVGEPVDGDILVFENGKWIYTQDSIIADSVLVSCMRGNLLDDISYLAINGLTNELSGMNNRKAVHAVETKYRLLTIDIQTNSGINETTVVITNEGVDGNQIVTIPAGTSGIFQDNVRSDIILALGLAVLKIDNTGNGTSVLMRSFSVVVKRN